MSLLTNARSGLHDQFPNMHRQLTVQNKYTGLVIKEDISPSKKVWF